MKIGIAGSGIAGLSIAKLLLKNGHDVMIGSRTGKSENAVKLVKRYEGKARQGTFTEAAIFGSLLFNCVRGIHSINVMQNLGAESLHHKIVIDITNPVDFSLGMPPRLTICNDNSSGEMLQKVLPESHVVKAFNTVPYEVMVNPGKINNKDIDMFICGDHSSAKEEVMEMIVKEFGWRRENVIDLGDIKHARSTEALYLLSCSMAMRFGTFSTMIKIHRK